jgi:hypothetical protein
MPFLTRIHLINRLSDPNFLSESYTIMTALFVQPLGFIFPLNRSELLQDDLSFLSRKGRKVAEKNKRNG